MFRFKTVVSIAAIISLNACSLVKTNEDNSPWHSLLDSELSQWEVWMGVPHSSVTGLPEGTYQADNLNVHGDTKDTMGLNNDIKKVFSVIEEEGETVLKISGEIYGGLTTLASYENYHLSMKVKWGDKKWAPRLQQKKDSGVLFHCQGEHGAFWKVWKACQELQIQESDFGDYIPLAGPSAKIRTSTQAGEFKYQPDGQYLRKVTGYSHASSEPDLPNGQWNQVDLYALNDQAIFVVNHEVVMVIEQSKDAQDQPLTSGQIQLQSEGAEVFYKHIKVRPLKTFPTRF